MEKWLNSFIKGLKVSSEKAVLLSKIYGLKVEIHFLLKKKKNHFTNIGEYVYTGLKDEKNCDQIMEKIQPELNEIEKLDQQIAEKEEKIESLKNLGEISSTIIDEIDKKARESDKED